MRFKGKWTERHKDSLKGAVLGTCFGLLFLLSPLGQDLKHLSYELPFLFRKTIHPDGAMILYMDDESHINLVGRWDAPWDRSLHANLLQTLTTLKAKAVVLDILFDSPSAEAADTMLFNAVTNHGKVIVATKVIPHILNGEVIGMKVSPLFNNFPHWGVAETSAEDKAIRQHYRDNICRAPSVAWTTAQLTMSSPPTDLWRARWVNYYGPPGTIPFYSYYEALSNRLSAAQVSNQVVFVGTRYSTGFTGGMGTEDFRTPYTRWTGIKSPGVEINATTYLNLLHGDWLNELPWAVEWIVIILFGVGSGFGLVFYRPIAALRLSLLLAIGVAAAAIILVWQTHLWFPWLILCGVQIPVTLGWSVLAYTQRLHRENEALARRVIVPKSTTLSPVDADSPSPAPAHATLAERYIHASPGAASPYRASPGGLTKRETVTPPPIPDHVLLRQIGQGSYGQVWLARDVIGTYHAVKVVFRNAFAEVAPYDREFRGIQKFTPISRSHPGFVHILHVGCNEEAGCFYYMMELGDDQTSGQQISPNSYVPKTLAGQLKKHGRLPVLECLQLSLDLTAALQYLHQHRLIHRDIKPSNIIYVNGQPKFADIGLVTEIAEADSDVSIVGTQGYLAPEGPGTPAADVFSLGKLLYEASTGLDRARFPELPTALVKSPDTLLLFQLNKIILKACEADSRRRYQSADAMRKDLISLHEHSTVEHKSRFWRWKKQ